MKNKIPTKLLKSSYRKELWSNAEQILAKIEKVIPISSMHLLGSFTTKKRRPANVDFIIMLHTPSENRSKWSLDIAIAPDNQYGEKILEDAKKWMKQKYGSKKSAVIKFK